VLKLKSNIDKLEKRLLKENRSVNPYFKDEMQILFDMKDALKLAKKVQNEAK